MAWAGRELAIAQGPQLARQRLLGDREAELLPEPLHQIDQAPAHHALDGRDRTLLHDGLQGLSVLVIEPRRGAWRSSGQEALGSSGVEAQHPVAHDLQGHAADLGRLGAGGSIIDRGHSQKASGLIGITRLLGQRAKLGGVKVGAKWDRGGHGDLRRDHRHPKPYRRTRGKPVRESTKLGLGIRPWLASGRRQKTGQPRSCAAGDVQERARDE